MIYSWEQRDADERLAPHLAAERDRYRSYLDILCQGIENGRGWPEHIGDVYKHCREALNGGTE